MKKIFKNKVLIFILSRYFSYFLQFVNSLVIAYALGPYYLGVWGFISLVLQYLAFGNFGIDIALNVNLSTSDFNDKEKQSEISSNALAATAITCSFFILLTSVFLFIDTGIFEKYMFTQFIFYLTLIACLNFFNILFLNIFRAHSLFTPISIFQTIVQLAQLPMFLFFEDTQLIHSLLIMMLLAHGISIVVFVKNLPFKIKFKVDPLVIKNLYKRGISLLIYALTFYLLLLSTRSMVSYFYPVETMGLFTFACNIASALIVGLSSLEFVLFPKMLNRLSADEITDKAIQTFTEVRYIYMATAFLVVVIGLICYPVLLHYFNAYASTVEVFSYLVLCQVIISSGFGYSTLIISKGKEMFLVLHGLIALAINLSGTLGAYYFFGINYPVMSLLLIFTFIYYDIQVIRKGRELLKMKSSIFIILNDLLPLRSVIPVILILCAIVTGSYQLFYPLSLVAFIALNFKAYHVIKKYASLLFNEPAVVNIKK